MESRFRSEDEILEIVTSFEDASIARGKWTHAEHLVVALYYLTHHDFETAYARMKSGIMNLLVEGFKLDLTKEMPYHETITVFWMRTVERHLTAGNSGVRRTRAFALLDTTNTLVKTYDKDYPLRFYSRERLFSDEARARYIEPDRQLSPSPDS